MGALAVLHPGVSDSFESATIDSLTTLASLTSVAFRNADLRDSQRNFFTHITDLVVTALDAHLGYHSGHSHRVAELANRIGRELALDEDCMQRLHFASLLHDIGMLKLDRDMQRSPRTCRKHAELGYRILNRIRLWQDLAPLVHYHHERWDGQGYPEGLLGDAIPVESRIIGFCEAFDTFANDASYKVALSWEDALREADACAGTQFDPQVVRAFRACVDRGDITPADFGSEASSSD
jgi:putative nucleotidyltransferase with HDIG domain